MYNSKLQKIYRFIFTMSTEISSVNNNSDVAINVKYKINDKLNVILIISSLITLILTFTLLASKLNTFLYGISLFVNIAILVLTFIQPNLLFIEKIIHNFANKNEDKLDFSGDKDIIFYMNQTIPYTEKLKTFYSVDLSPFMYIDFDNYHKYCTFSSKYGYALIDLGKNHCSIENQSSRYIKIWNDLVTKYYFKLQLIGELSDLAKKSTEEIQPLPINKEEYTKLVEILADFMREADLLLSGDTYNTIEQDYRELSKKKLKIFNILD